MSEETEKFDWNDFWAVSRLCVYGLLAVIVLMIPTMLTNMSNENHAREAAHEAELEAQGYHKMEAINAKYLCPNDGWAGIPGNMTTYHTGLFNDIHYCCPLDGYEFHIPGGYVWVNAEGIYQEGVS